MNEQEIQIRANCQSFSSALQFCANYGTCLWTKNGYNSAATLLVLILLQSIDRAHTDLPSDCLFDLARFLEHLEKYGYGFMFRGPAGVTQVLRKRRALTFGLGLVFVQYLRNPSGPPIHEPEPKIFSKLPRTWKFSWGRYFCEWRNVRKYNISRTLHELRI